MYLIYTYHIFTPKIHNLQHQIIDTAAIIVVRI